MKNLKKCTTFVLSGGGSHGALQVGAMKALLEQGIVPDLLVGSSIGAVNAAGLALLGVNLDGINKLQEVWAQVSNMQLLDPRVMRLMFRTILLGRSNDCAKRKIEDFFISQGFLRGLQFYDLPSVKLGLISADIETGEPVIFGKNLDDSVLEGLISSIALPPWFTPIAKDGQLMIDGGAFCHLPIEPALRMGATEIYAFDLEDPDNLPKKNLSFTQYFEKYLYAINRRHVSLETALAEAQGVPIYNLEFRGLAAHPIWDFNRSQELIQSGYESALSKIKEWNMQFPYRWFHSAHEEQPVK